MKSHSDLELKIFEQGLSEDNHYSNILNDMRFRGWFKFETQEGFNTHTFCIFRLPAAIPLYENVLKRFTDEERMAGLHRLLIGKELREEMDTLLAQFGGNINDCVANLDDSEVNELLGRLQKVVTFDCNKIPYLHIKLLRDDPTVNININEEVKKHVLNLPNYLEIFYEVINEKISISEATNNSNGIIFNEYSQILNK